MMNWQKWSVLLTWSVIPLAIIPVLYLAGQAPAVARMSAKSDLPCIPSGPYIQLGKDQVPLAASQGQATLSSSVPIFMTVCRPGRLSLKIRGQPSAGTFPLMNLSVGLDSLQTTTVQGVQNYGLAVPHAGMVALTYLNDDAFNGTGQDRSMFLYYMKFTPN